MKIDPRTQFPNDPSSQQVKGARTGASSSKSSSKSSGVSSPSGEDTVKLSSVHGEVQTLTAGVTQVPEVRTERVQALQAKVREGKFNPDSAAVADAMIKEHARVNTRA
ncbi:MAG TPA: flagellar biosynthesis anti-sigma factor FlgM [Methylomirabilota bacterium]|nr:flagellar biosynthesis anti-sigma factor FlgM [Methylomirabilota bacterium]